MEEHVGGEREKEDEKYEEGMEDEEVEEDPRKGK